MTGLGNRRLELLQDALVARHARVVQRNLLGLNHRSRLIQLLHLRDLLENSDVALLLPGLRNVRHHHLLRLLLHMLAAVDVAVHVLVMLGVDDLREPSDAVVVVILGSLWNLVVN